MFEEITPDPFQSGQRTAKRAAEILVEKDLGFSVPTAKQRQNLLVAFAKKGKVVYGRAFDIVSLSREVHLDQLDDVEKNLDAITVYEIKSTRRAVKEDFKGFFFSLTGAELLVAQSLKHQFKFALVNTTTKTHLELDIAQLFAKARGIYPAWSVML